MGARVNQSDNYGNPPLFGILQRENSNKDEILAILDMMCKAGALTYLANAERKTMLHLACEDNTHSRLGLVQGLLARQADPIKLA